MVRRSIEANMSAHTSAPASRRWWHRLFGGSGDQPYGLTDGWTVVDGAAPRTEIAVGQGGVFLLDHRRSRPEDVARAAGDLSGRLTASLGHCVRVQGVLVESAERPVRADQPAGVTIVTEVVLGAWLESHPRAFDDREVRMLLGTLRPASVSAGTR